MQFIGALMIVGAMILIGVIAAIKTIKKEGL